MDSHQSLGAWSLGGEVPLGHTRDWHAWVKQVLMWLELDEYCDIVVHAGSRDENTYR